MDGDTLTKIGGDRIRAARKALGLTQTDIGRLTCLSQSAIANYEQAIRVPSPDVAVRLGNALGVAPAYLLGLDPGGDLTPDERRLLAIFRRTDERGRRSILTIAKAQDTIRG